MTEDEVIDQLFGEFESSDYERRRGAFTHLFTISNEWNVDGHVVARNLIQKITTRMSGWSVNLRSAYPDQEGFTIVVSYDRNLTSLQDN